MDNFTPFEQKAGYALAAFILRNIRRVTSIFLDLSSGGIHIERFFDEFMNIFRDYSPAVPETIDRLRQGDLINEMNAFLENYFRFYSNANGGVIFVQISPLLLELGSQNHYDDPSNIEAMAAHQLEQLREMYHSEAESPPSPEPDIPDYESEFNLNRCAVNTGPERRTGGVPKSRVKGPSIVGQQRSQRTPYQPTNGAMTRFNEPSTSSSSSGSSRNDPRSRSSSRAPFRSSSDASSAGFHHKPAKPTNSDAMESRNRRGRSPTPINRYEPNSSGSSRYQDEPSYMRSSVRSTSTSSRMYQTSQQGSSSQFSSSVPSRGGKSGGFSNMRHSKDPQDKINSGRMSPRQEARGFQSFLYDDPGTSYSSSDPSEHYSPLFQPARQHRPHESSSEYRLHRSPSIHQHRFNNPQTSREPQFRFTETVFSDNRDRRTDRRESGSDSTGRSRLGSREESLHSQTSASSIRQSSDEPSSVYFSAASEFGNSDRRESSAYNSDANPIEETSLHRPKAVFSHIPRNSRDSDEFSSMDEAFVQEKDSGGSSDDTNSMSRRLRGIPGRSMGRKKDTTSFKIDDDMTKINEKLKLVGFDKNKPPPSFGHHFGTHDSSARSSEASQAPTSSFNSNAPIFVPHAAHSSQSTTSSTFSVRSYLTHTVTLRHDGPTHQEEHTNGECVRCKHMLCNGDVLIRCPNCKRVQCLPNHYINPDFRSKAKPTCFHCHAPLD